MQGKQFISKNMRKYKNIYYKEYLYTAKYAEIVNKTLMFSLSM